MGNYLTVIKTNKKLSQKKFLEFSKKHWDNLQIEESFDECEDMCVDIFNTILDKKYVSDYAGSIQGGIIRLLEKYLKTKESKIIVNHEEFYGEDMILVIT